MPQLDTPDGPLHCEVIDITAPWVENPQTILFHHGVSTTGAIWSEWLPQLVDRYRIVRFDTRGFGRSAVPGPGFAWTMDGLVADALAVAGAAGAGRFHCVGESIGGTVALALASRHPDRLLSLTVSNGAHRGTAVQNVRGRWDRRIADDGQEAWADEMMGRRFFPGALSEAKHRWFAREHATCSAQVTLGLANLLLETDLAPEVGGIRMPVLLLSPDASPFIPPSAMCDLHAALPDSELQVFARSRHGLPLSHGRECAAALRSFLDRRFGAG